MMSVIDENVADEVYRLGSVISLPAFQITTAIVFGLAIVSAFARTVMRIATRRPIYWDDFFLAVAVACLIATTGLLYKNVYYLYMLSAIGINPAIAFGSIYPDLNHLFTISLAEAYAADCLAWTTIFCVKASFLIISKQLIKRLPRLRIYFWVIAVLTGLSWATLVCTPFIQCPQFGFTSLSCAASDQQPLYSSLNGLIASLDILTDLLIASIPIIILWRSSMDSKQKFVVGPFLTLSLVMIAFSAVRVSRSKTASKVDVIWLIFWQYLEASIAVIVTSITTIRTVFIARKIQRSPPPEVSSFGSMLRSRGSGRILQYLAEDEDHLISVPPVPTPPTRIMIHETWGVSYSSIPRSSEDFLTPATTVAVDSDKYHES